VKSTPGVAPRRRWARLGPRIAVPLTTTILTLGAGELLVRLIAARNESRQEHTAGRPTGLPELRTLFELARRNTRGTFKGVLFETNSGGFRGREISEEKPVGTRRIVIIGDSFTMGSGVRFEDTYAEQLERLLSERSTGERYEVLNLGLAGLNLYWSVESRLKKIGLRYDPDLIIYGFTINDLEGPNYRKSLQTRSAPRLRSLLWALAVERWRYYRDLIAPPKGSYIWELDDNFFHNDAAWGAFTASLADLARIGGDQGVCVVVFLHTQLNALNRWHPFTRHYSAAATEARRLGMYVIDPFPYLEGKEPTAFHVGPLDPHPNATGHAIYAEALAEGLKHLPPSCWERKK
jgi:lysophospholipase L1-like esterase